MIKYSNNTINDWNFGASNLIKVYRNNAVCYYKISGDAPTPTAQTPCYAVVDDISQYSDTEFDDVFNKADGKWYKLNNLNQYEEYGIYGSGRTICEGSTSRLPQGYTEVEYVQNTGSSTINTNFYPNTNTRVLCEMEMITTQSYPKLFGAGTWNVNNSLYIEFATSLSVHWIGSTSTYSDYPKSFAFAKHKYDLDKGNLYINDTLVGTKTYSSVVSVSSPLGIFSYINNSTAGNVDEHFLGKLYTFKIYDDGTLVRDFVPAKRDSDNVAGLYDIVNDVFYTPMETNIPLVAGDPVTPTDCVTTYNGKLTIDGDYEYQYSGGSWVNVGEVSGGSISDDYVIPFADSTVKTICVNNWGGNVVAGELTYGEAKQVTSLGSVFKNNTSISSFNELVYFKGLTNLDNGEFAGCRNLTDIVIPNNITTLGYNLANRSTFSGCTNLSGVTMLSGGETLLLDLTANNGSYYMNSSHQNVPMIFPDRQITMTTGTFGYYDYLAIVYFQSSTPPANLANADINNYRKLANVYCPVGSLSAYQTALSGKGKTITEYDFETDSLGLLTKEKEWAAKTSSPIVYPIYYSEMQDPPNNVSFSSMTEAESYECPWVGMQAIINGSAYTFSGDAISGYEWIYNPIDYSTHYLSMVAETNNVSFAYDTASSNNVIQYSTDSGTTWSNLTNGNSTPSVNLGEKVMFKCSGLTVDTERGIGRITPSAQASVEGNVMSLVYGDNFAEQTVISNNFQLRKLFNGVTTITSAENMVLPATTVTKQCYSQMFQGCANLTTPPKVVGASAMTWNGDYCFSDMFNRCTSMTTAPELPALNLGTQCYWYMFQGCTSLTTAPELLATTVNTQSYNGMFSGCTSLNYIKVMASNGFTMNEWVKGVASSGTFVKNSTATFSSCSSNTYPCNWTVQDYT